MDGCKLFQNSLAWFSSSVSEELKTKWELNGGMISDSLDDVHYIFSSNAKSDDTRRAFKTIRGTNLVMFKPKWIDYAIKISNNVQLTPLGIERFILLPEFVNIEYENHSGNAKEEVENHWKDFEAELLDRISPGTPQRFSKRRVAELNPLHSTIVKTPVRALRKETPSCSNHLLSCSSERKKLKIRHDLLSQPPLTLTSSPLNKLNCSVIIEDCSGKLNKLKKQTKKNNNVDFQVARNEIQSNVKKSSIPQNGSILSNVSTKVSRKGNVSANDDGSLSCSQSAADSNVNLNGSFRAYTTDRLNERSSSPMKNQKIDCETPQQVRVDRVAVPVNSEKLPSTRRRQLSEKNRKLIPELDGRKTDALQFCNNNINLLAEIPLSERVQMHSEKRPVPFSRPMRSEKKSADEKDKKHYSLRSKRVSETEVRKTESPSTCRKKRKLYRKCSDSMLDTSALVDESETPSHRRSAEEQLSPVDIHDILNSGGKEISLSGKRQSYDPDTLRGIESTPLSKREIKSCVEIMQKHKEIVDVKVSGQKRAEEFTYGSFSGFVHIDRLKIPDLEFEDFVINKAGCRVELVRR